MCCLTSVWTDENIFQRKWTLSHVFQVQFCNTFDYIYSLSLSPSPILSAYIHFHIHSPETSTSCHGRFVFNVLFQKSVFTLFSLPYSLSLSLSHSFVVASLSLSPYFTLAFTLTGRMHYSRTDWVMIVNGSQWFWYTHSSLLPLFLPTISFLKKIQKGKLT